MFDISKKWSLTDKSLGARDSHGMGKYAKSRHNCETSPLFNFIPIDHVIIDTLHLFLRISDNFKLNVLSENFTEKMPLTKYLLFQMGFVETGTETYGWV